VLRIFIRMMGSRCPAGQPTREPPISGSRSNLAPETVRKRK
jgi:hypothetical protein